MEQGEISLSDREFTRIKGRVYQGAGISLSDAKRTLVVSRLSRIVRGLGLAVTVEQAPFEPEAGAYGGHSHSALAPHAHG